MTVIDERMMCGSLCGYCIGIFITVKIDGIYYVI